jgi:hypothetical protein
MTEQSRIMWWPSARGKKVLQCGKSCPPARAGRQQQPSVPRHDHGGRTDHSREEVTRQNCGTTSVRAAQLRGSHHDISYNPSEKTSGRTTAIETPTVASYGEQEFERKETNNTDHHLNTGERGIGYPSSIRQEMVQYFYIWNARSLKPGIHLKFVMIATGRSNRSPVSRNLSGL